MATVLGLAIPIKPLTREEFGPDGDRVIIGCIQSFGDMNRSQGVCLTTMKEGHFSHPELLDQFAGDGTLLWVQVTLVNDVIEVHGVDPFTKKEVLPDAEVFRSGKAPTASPVKLKKFSTVDAILAYDKILREQEHTCHNDACPNHQIKHMVELRTGALVQIGLGDPVALCAKCTDDEFKKEETSWTWKVILDGRTIPAHAPVGLWPT